MALAGYPKEFIHPTISIFEIYDDGTTGSGAQQRNAVTNTPNTVALSNVGNYALVKVHGATSTDWAQLRVEYSNGKVVENLYVQPGQTLRGPIRQVRFKDEGTTLDYATHLLSTPGGGSGAVDGDGSERDIYLTFHEVKEDV